MGYRSLADCVEDLRRTGRLVAIDREVDPRLEAAAIQRRVDEAGGRCTTFDGGAPHPDGSFVATNGLLHDEVVALLA